MPQNARELAHQVLLAVENGPIGSQEALARAFAEESSAETKASAPGHSRALVSELVYGVLRRRRRLDHALSELAPRGLPRDDPALLTALRIAAYQLLFMPKIPDYAAVNSGVTLVKRSLRGARRGNLKTGRGAATVRFSNGILRALAARREALSACPEGSSIAALGCRHSLPDWIVERLAAIPRGQGVLLEDMLTQENLPAPLVLRANRARIETERLVDLLRSEGAALESVPDLPGGIVVSNPGDIFRGPSFAGGLWLPQSLASQRVVTLLDLEPGMRVLDLCAGGGVKTTQIAEIVGNAGEVHAVDVDKRKIAALRELARRWGAECVRAEVADLTSASAPFDGLYERVLLDAPCTALGLLRRRPEVRWRRTMTDVRERAALQAKLLAAAARRIAPGGRLVYAVCSFTAEEGPDQVRRLLEERSDLRLASPPTDQPRAARFGPDGFFRTGPEWGGEGDGDRFFASILHRVRGPRGVRRVQVQGNKPNRAEA